MSTVSWVLARCVVVMAVDDAVDISGMGEEDWEVVVGEAEVDEDLP